MQVQLTETAEFLCQVKHTGDITLKILPKIFREVKLDTANGIEIVNCNGSHEGLHGFRPFKREHDCGIPDPGSFGVQLSTCKRNGKCRR